jgi:hypothetical protein
MSELKQNTHELRYKQAADVSSAKAPEVVGGESLVNPAMYTVRQGCRVAKLLSSRSRLFHDDVGFQSREKHDS